MSKEPEQMLEQHRITTTCCIEKAGAEMAIKQQHGDRTGQYRYHQNQQKGGDQPGPAEDWHLHQGHAWSAHIEDGDDDIDRCQHRRYSKQMDGKDQKVHGHSHLHRKRRINGPAGVDLAAASREKWNHERQQQHGSGRWQDPETQVIQAWQRHIRCTNHQWQHPVGQTGRSRHYRPKDHDQGMVGNQVVVQVRIYQLNARHK